MKISSNTKLRWRCAKGHEWKALYSSIKQGSWCPICWRKITIQDCKKLATNFNGKCLSTIYTNRTENLKWKCSEGHQWSENYSYMQILIKSGKICCPYCDNRASSLLECHKIAKSFKGNCLTVSNSDFKRFLNTKKFEWKCSEGHQWKATLNEAKEKWCPICSRENVAA